MGEIRREFWTRGEGRSRKLKIKKTNDKGDVLWKTGIKVNCALTLQSVTHLMGPKFRSLFKRCTKNKKQGAKEGKGLHLGAEKGYIYPKGIKDERVKSYQKKGTDRLGSSSG